MTTPKVKWNEPLFGEEEARAVAAVLKSGFVTEGPVSAELTERLKTVIGVKHVTLTTSGAAALFLAAKATQVVEDAADFEVLVPDLTFVASATSVQLAGGRPVLVDVEPERFCIDVDDARRKITPRTRAIMPVHVIGRACDLRAIAALAEEHDLYVIEDAANALGSRGTVGRLGGLGDAGCFSFQANKSVSCGHGGCVATDDDTIHEVVTRLKDFGRFDKHEALHAMVGYNFKFNDILAAVALEQLKRLPEKLALLCAQRRRYEANLAGCEAVRFPPVRFDEGEVPLYVDALVSRRDDLRAHLQQRGIETRECWPPLHRNPPYREQGGDDGFPVSARVADDALWLPNGGRVGMDAIDAVSALVREFYR